MNGVVLYDPERRWRPYGACVDEDPELFFPLGPAQPGRAPTPAIQEAWNKAKEVCAHCPVLEECRRDSLGEEYGVWGGRDEHQRYNLRSRQRAHARWWSTEVRLAWGEHLAMLRKGGLQWADIRRMAGMTGGLAVELIAEWAEHCKTLAEAAPVAAEAEPLPDREIPAPPEEAPHRRPAWVWHNGLWRGAHYRGQTADGAWLSMLIRAGRGQSMIWARAEHVHIRHPQPVVILQFAGRPDEPIQQAEAG